jgi:hypothetical protein
MHIAVSSLLIFIVVGLAEASPREVTHCFIAFTAPTGGGGIAESRAHMVRLVPQSNHRLGKMVFIAQRA